MNTHQEITNKILCQMKKAKVNGEEWSMPWNANNGMPSNAITGSVYRGINVIALWSASMEKSYKTNKWATLNQWKKVIDGRVLIGDQKPSTAVFFKYVESRTNKAGEEKNGYRLAKPFWLFNIDQVNFELPEKDPVPEFERHGLAENWIAAQFASIDHGYDHACYIPKSDRIQMPKAETFKDQDSYYGVLFHELIHWSGSKKRLDRIESTVFRSEAYAFEELVAELGSAFCCAETEIRNEPRKDNAEYLNAWIRHLESDPKFIFKAAAMASKAVEFIRENVEKAIAA